MTESASVSSEPLAGLLLAALRDRTVGSIFFWRFAPVRPQDQAFIATSVSIEGERFDLELSHAAGTGSPAALSIWSPGGLEVTATSVCLRQAARLRLGRNEAWADGDDYRIRTPFGEGSFSRGDSPALILQF
jgi:hypothetical protein